MTIELGIFDHLDMRDEPLSLTYADRITMVRAAEAAGFRRYQLAEHHGTPLGSAPSPGLFLAALAQATSKIRIGPLVYLLPLYTPLRLIEEICMLDNLSNGRLEAGVGRGASPIETGFYGVSAEEAVERFVEALEVVIQGLNSDRLSYRGKYYQYDDVPMSVRPLQSPLPLWSASMSPDGQREAAKRGMHSIGLGPSEGIRRVSENYYAEWEANKDDPLRPVNGVQTPLVGAWRMFYVNENERQAQAIAKQAYDDWFTKLHKLWVENNIQAPHLGPMSRFETAVESGMLVHGPASKVLDELAQQVELTGINYLALQPAFGDIGHDEEMRSLERFVSGVMPYL